MARWSRRWKITVVVGPPVSSEKILGGCNISAFTITAIFIENGFRSKKKKTYADQNAANENNRCLPM
jgi:hypothetical protein